MNQEERLAQEGHCSQQKKPDLRGLDPPDAYHLHYPGKSRTELKQENQSLYQKLGTH